MDDVITGEGWAVSNLDRLGDGPGFRKIRTPLGVTAFGINAIVLPPGIETGRHSHERQQEVYFLHAGRIEIEFGDGATQTLEPGGIARVDAVDGAPHAQRRRHRRGLRRRRRRRRLRRARRRRPQEDEARYQATQ